MTQYIITHIPAGLNQKKLYFSGTHYCQSIAPIFSFSKNVKDALTFETEKDALRLFHQINKNERLDPYTKDVYGDYYGIYRVEKYNPETKVVGDLADFKTFENRTLQIL